MVPPIFSNKVKRGLNPQTKAFTKPERGLKSVNKRFHNVHNPQPNINIENKSQGKRSVADCGSVAKGPVATNTVSKQGILTSNKFPGLIEVPWEDDSVCLHDDSPSCLSNSHVKGTTPIRTTVSVTSSTARVPIVSDSNIHENDDLGKISFKGNKNKTGLSNQGSN